MGCLACEDEEVCSGFILKQGGCDIFDVFCVGYVRDFRNALDFCIASRSSLGLSVKFRRAPSSTRPNLRTLGRSMNKARTLSYSMLECSSLDVIT
jgi:hypothetical protein